MTVIQSVTKKKKIGLRNILKVNKKMSAYNIISKIYLYGIKVGEMYNIVFFTNLKNDTQLNYVNTRLKAYPAGNIMRRLSSS